MTLKRKRLSSNAGISDKAHRWVKLRKQAKEIKPSPLTSWVDKNGVPGEEGTTAPVDWKDLISSDVDSRLVPYTATLGLERMFSRATPQRSELTVAYETRWTSWYSVNRLQACVSVTDIPQGCPNYITEPPATPLAK